MHPPPPLPHLPLALIFLSAGFVAFTGVLFFALHSGSEPTMALRDAMVAALGVGWLAKTVAASLNHSFAQTAYAQAKAQAEEEDRAAEAEERKAS
jgi:hypothetical protein